MVQCNFLCLKFLTMVPKVYRVCYLLNTFPNSPSFHLKDLKKKTCLNKLLHRNREYSYVEHSDKFGIQFSSVSRIRLLATPSIGACQASLSYQLPDFTQTHVHQVGDAISHLILCCPLRHPPPIWYYTHEKRTF